ncbi:hypothetical protein CVT25_004718, partial [Psilocybe cyanescens]
GVLNSDEFPALLDEIYLEITSPDIGRINRHQSSSNSISNFVRALTDVPLSASYLWQCIEVFDEMAASKGPLMSTSAETVLAEVARCTGILPNLHTVQFDFFSVSTNMIMNTFTRCIYRQVRTLSITSHHSYAHFVDTYFPQLQRISPYMHHPFLKLPTTNQSIETIGLTVLSTNHSECEPRLIAGR